MNRYLCKIEDEDYGDWFYYGKDSKEAITNYCLDMQFETENTYLYIKDTDTDIEEKYSFKIIHYPDIYKVFNFIEEMKKYETVN